MGKIITTIQEIRNEVQKAVSMGQRVALVPTMGYLHEGHMRLVEAARRDCDFVVVSIFVNPTQFGKNEDFDRYPRDMERDQKLCREAGVSAIFAPEVGEMYPQGFQTVVSVTELSKPLCGRFRLGHFEGVASVVLKLFNIVKPHVAYFGQKDYQQLAVIRRMAVDLDLDLDVIGIPTVRDPDGLAMSSRNVYLSPDERVRALSISASLARADEMARSGVEDSAIILSEVKEMLAEAGLDLEYAELRDPGDLTETLCVKGPTLLAIAARCGRTRLIDNKIIFGE